jgi:hypothetical protein
MAAFLKEDLAHLFDDTGIDAAKYEPQMARRAAHALPFASFALR